MARTTGFLSVHYIALQDVTALRSLKLLLVNRTEVSRPF